MAGSQLKRLKASLREQGITGPQQSKKQRRKNAQDERARNEKRLQRGVVLEGIREQFNPFDLKHAARGPKFDVTTSRPATSSIKGRPGQAKAASEERRKQTLLLEMQRRNKVGGILDRRFGEDDPTMTPEEKMLERFAQEKQRSHKKNTFDLEDDEEDPSEGLTHGGKALTFDGEPVEDFQEDDLDEDYDSDGSVRERQRLKRIRAMAGEDGDDDGEPERKKTKKEVMEEIIAKSKMHKFERQAAKEEDEDLRHAINQDLPEILGLLSKNNSKWKADQSNGAEREAFDKDFDLQVKRLAQDKRAQPADRTKTDEEKAEDESKRLRELEEKRQKRMRGEPVSDSDEEPEKEEAEQPEDMDSEEDFGLGDGIKSSSKKRPTATELGFDDEDDFFIDDDLVASGSDLEPVDSDEFDEEDGEESEEGEDEDEEEDDEFTKGLLNVEEATNPVFTADSAKKTAALEKGDEKGLPYTFSCPQSCSDIQSLADKYPVDSLPTVVQRIRALYHPKLDSRHKETLGNFAVALVDFISQAWNTETTSSSTFKMLESLIRHIHSLAKMFPGEIAKQFRQHLEEISQERPLNLETGDLLLLTAIGSIFPTSDHFHQVVTPAMLTMARYLGQKVPQSAADFSTGVYLSILTLQYQQLAKRYVPEVVNFGLNTLCALAPAASNDIGTFPLHSAPKTLRIKAAIKVKAQPLSFSDIVQGVEDEAIKVSIVDTTLQIFDVAADTWTGKSAFTEIFKQVFDVVKHLTGKKCRSRLSPQLCDRADKLQTKLERMLRLANLSRRPLELHTHRRLAIKTYIPKFEETFDPTKHYDPDRERVELAKLKAEHKKERKGAMRELRKDANFMAREKLRAKKAKDEAYEKKYKRLVAEIQSEEGREANAYERERNARKRARNR